MLKGTTRHVASNHMNHYLYCCRRGLGKELRVSIEDLSLEARKQRERTLNLP